MRFSSPSMSFLRKIVACFLLVSMILTLSSCNGEEESSSAPAPVVTTPQVTEAPLPEPEEDDQLQIQQPDADTLQKLTDMQSANSDTPLPKTCSCSSIPTQIPLPSRQHLPFRGVLLSFLILCIRYLFSYFVVPLTTRFVLTILLLSLIHI